METEREKREGKKGREEKKNDTREKVERELYR